MRSRSVLTPITACGWTHAGIRRKCESTDRQRVKTSPREGSLLGGHSSPYSIGHFGIGASASRTASMRAWGVQPGATPRPGIPACLCCDAPVTNCSCGDTFGRLQVRIRPGVAISFADRGAVRDAEGDEQKATRHWRCPPTRRRAARSAVRWALLISPSSGCRSLSRSSVAYRFPRGLLPSRCRQRARAGQVVTPLMA